MVCVIFSVDLMNSLCDKVNGSCIISSGLSYDQQEVKRHVKFVLVSAPAPAYI